MRKVSSAEAINSIDSLLLYLRQEELNINIELQTSKLRKSVLGNIMQKRRQTIIFNLSNKNLCVLIAIIKSTIFIGYSY